MRKISLLIVLVAALAFSCSSDDDANGGGGVSLNGTYTLTSLVPSQGIDADANGTFNTSDITDLLNCDFRIIISDDNTFVINFQSLSVFQSSSASSGPGGVDVEVNLNPVACDTYTRSGTFSLIEGNILLTYDDEEVGFPQEDIVSINEGEITFVYTEFFYTSLEEINPSSVQFTATFNKQ